MQTLRTLRAARLVASLSLSAITAVVAACSADDAQIGAGPASSATAARELPDAAAADAPPDAPRRATAIDVEGEALLDTGEPVVGRTIVVRDARDARFETMTDEGGAFFVDGVVPPYDLSVAPAPSGVFLVPTAYLGLTRRNPSVTLVERDGTETPLATESIRVAVDLPPCPSTCWIFATSSSISGAGAAAASYATGASRATLDLDHTWNGFAISDGESIDLDVLVGDAEYTQYAYARLSAVPARPGGHVDVGALRPLHVESTAPLAIASGGSPLRDGWSFMLSAWLDLPGAAGRAQMPLRFAPASSLAMRLPSVPGAYVRVAVSAEEEGGGGGKAAPYFDRSTEAWSGILPVAGGTVSLALPSTVAPIRPTAEGRLSRRGVGPSWDMTGRAGLTSYTITRIDSGRPVVRAFTTGDTLAWKRLDGIGIARPERGAHVADVSFRDGATVDELVASGRVDPKDQAGSTTYQRFRFEVVK